MTSAKKAANPAGGKTAKACDSCVSKRARWYCAADDAFLCQGCDSSVHSANPLARRHERVRLKMTSWKSFDSAKRELNCAPSWHKGFTKKARTPRNGKHYAPAATPSNAKSPFHLVPEEGSDDTNSHEDSKQQLLYRVPILEPFAAELCTTPSSMTSSPIEVETKCSNGSDSRVLLGFNNHRVIHGFLPMDIELFEFAADVESLLGMGLENQCMGMEELGLVGNKEQDSSWEYCLVGNGKLKVEEEERPEVADATTCKVEEDHVEMERESFELSFDYDDDDSPAGCEEVVVEKVALEMTEDANNGGELREDSQAKRKILLQLDYEAVITAWASRKSPWTTGDKPDFDIDQSWPYCMGSCEMLELHQPYCEFGGLFGGRPAMADGGREARVSRYREKRRTRWFSKKIRYEVRKLNAEKRPRLKGRFVKRGSSAPPPTFPLVTR